MSAQDAEAGRGVEPASYIESLRSQFVTLASSGDAASTPLYISPIEVELSASVVAEANGKITFHVIDAGGGVSTSATQRLKVTVSVGDPEQPYYQTYLPGMEPPMTAAGWASTEITRVPSEDELMQNGEAPG